MAPGANILLVETPVAETEGIVGIPQMVEAENYVIDHHLGDVISQSWGATEQTFTSPQQLLGQRSAYLNALAHNVSVLASSGDTGATNYEFDGSDLYPFPAIGWPASDPLVTAVGGLQLHLNNSGFRTQPDNVWNDPAPPCSGQPCAGSGGLSSVFSRPFYQDGVRYVVDGRRGIPDVSLNAAVSSAVNIYLSFSPTRRAFGRRSPARVRPRRCSRESWPSPTRRHATTSGGSTRGSTRSATAGSRRSTTSRGATTRSRGSSRAPARRSRCTGYNATPGYDLASGLGDPDGARLVAALAGFRQR